MAADSFRGILGLLLEFISYTGLHKIGMFLFLTH